MVAVFIIQDFIFVHFMNYDNLDYVRTPDNYSNACIKIEQAMYNVWLIGNGKLKKETSTIAFGRRVTHLFGALNKEKISNKTHVWTQNAAFHFTI